MNELLQQLLSMGPGIGQMLSGNGPEAQSFMDGYLRTQQMLQQQKRQTQQDQIAQQDRERLIQRQTQADQRTATDQQWQDTQRLLSLEQLFSQSAATADTVPDAEASIDAKFGLATPEQQVKLAPARDAAMRGALGKVTTRQKGELRRWLSEDLEKSEFIAPYKGHGVDVDVTRAMPTRIRQLAEQLTGKTSFTKNELYALAETLEQATPAKTRTPAAAGSFEEYADPATPPERRAEIERLRKGYQQADDRPTVNVTLPGGISGKAGDAALKFQDDYARDSKPYLTMREAYQRVKSAKPDAAGDLSLIFAYMKILDPNSVVREQEFANAQNAAGVPDRVRNTYNRVMKGERLNPEQRRQFLSQAEALFEGAKTNQRQVRGTYGKRAKDWGIPETMVLDEEDEFLRAVTPPPVAPAQATGGPKPGERRKIKGQLAEWDGQGWVAVKP